MRRRMGMAVLAASCGAILAAGVTMAADWPQWRGPNRDGALPDFQTPKTWPKQLERRWSVEVGTGHASPVVAGDRVFMLGRQGDNEVVRALRLADGKELWSQSYPAAFQMSPYALFHGRGPKSTPLVAGGRLFTLGISNLLSCWDAQDGKRIWQVDFAKTYPKTSSLWYGVSSSPALEGDMLIAQVGGREAGAIVALDAASGAVRWKWEGDGSAYASPIAATLGGTRQIITQSRTACVSVAASSGELLWRLPLETEYDQNIITPIIAGDLVIFGGLHQPTAAYRVKSAGGKWSPEKVWENADLTLYMSTPVLVGNRLVGLANRQKGQFFALDAATGKTLWTSEGRMGDYVTLVAAKDLVLAQTSGGELLVFPAAAERFSPIARYQTSDKPVWAHLAVVGNQFLVKDPTSLTLWTLGK